MKIYVVGIGMGNPDTLTVEAKRAIEECQLLVGAPRLLELFASSDREKRAQVRTADIVYELQEAQDRGVNCTCVLVSGDVGFYSAAPLLYQHLEGYDVRVLPGISSLQYFCAKLQVPWQDVTVVSAHGRSHNAAGAVQANKKVFCLTGGDTKVQDICAELVERGLGEVQVCAGERLSYADERIVRGTAAELAAEEFLDLAVMLVQNPRPVKRRYAAPSLTDGDFERGRAPMTKEEVRALVVSKLRIEPEHVVWDVGAGTGSVSVEAALAAPMGRVFAIERNEDALELLRAAKKRHGVCNMNIVPGEAPDALVGLPTPSRVFIGGSGGQMRRILQTALEANPWARICATAVTLETLSELLTCIKDFNLHADVVQLAVSRASEAGQYHLMRAENPVYVVTVWHELDDVFGETVSDGSQDEA